MPRDIKSHFGRKHTIGTMSSAKLDALEKGRAAASKQNADEMRKYTDKDEWEKHLKSKVQSKIKEKQDEGKK